MLSSLAILIHLSFSCKCWRFAAFRRSNTMESSSSDRITIEWNKLSYTVKKTKINWFKLKRSKEYLEILKSGKNLNI